LQKEGIEWSGNARLDHLFLNKTMTQKNYNQWEIKFLRENWMMPFGSLLNAYAQMNQQKPKEMKEFLTDIDELFLKAIRLTKKSLDRSTRIELKQIEKIAKERIKKVEVATYWDEMKQEIFNKDSQLDDLQIETNKNL
jgi:mevalonate kinase